MESEENRLCQSHKAENDFYCLTCNKAICINCKYVHPKDHMQIIHLAELAGNMVLQVKTKVAAMKEALTREDDEIASMAREFEEDKRYLYSMMKKLERMLVQMLHTSTVALTKALQKNDEELKSLKTKINEKKVECEQSEKLLKQLMDLNMKKEYWQMYLIQDKMKKGNANQQTSVLVSGLKKNAIEEAVSRGQSKSKAGDPSSVIIPPEVTLKKEQLRKLIAVTDYSYMNDISKEIGKALTTANKWISNEVSKLKQAQNVFYIKNNPEPTITKRDKQWLTSWIIGTKSGKSLELELLYKGTRDGFGASDFHSKCDGKSPTLVVITAEGETFGGYTMQPWAGPSPGIYKEDSNAFTYSLTKKIKCPINSDKRQMAVRHLESAGPAFGTMEILLSNQCNANSESCAMGGTTYVLPPDQDSKTFYTGKENFQVSEVEVYRVKIS